MLPDRRDVPRRAPRVAELRTERTDVAVDDVAWWRAGRAPDRAPDRLAADGMAGVLGEHEQDRLLGAREVGAAVPHRTRFSMTSTSRSPTFTAGTNETRWPYARRRTAR